MLQSLYFGRKRKKRKQWIPPQLAKKTKTKKVAPKSHHTTWRVMRMFQRTTKLLRGLSGFADDKWVSA